MRHDLDTRFPPDFDFSPWKWWIVSLFVRLWDVSKQFWVWFARKTLQNHKFESIAQEANACFAYKHDWKSYFGFQTGSNPPKLIGSSESIPTIDVKRKLTLKYSIFRWYQIMTFFKWKSAHKKKPLLQIYHEKYFKTAHKPEAASWKWYYRNCMFVTKHRN